MSHIPASRRSVLECLSILTAAVGTPEPPGSPAKIDVMAERARLRLPLFLPDDARLADAQVLRPVRAANGERMAADLCEQTADGQLRLVQAAPPVSTPPRPARPSVITGRLDPAWRAREAERKRRERARRRRQAAGQGAA